MLEQLLLEKNAQRKLVIYQILSNLPSGTYTVNTIENECEYAYRRVKSLLNEIHEDLKEISEPTYFLLDEDGRVNLTETFIRYANYQQLLLKNSLPYQLLLHTLIHPEDKLQDFCEKHFVSSASVSRIIRPLQAYLQEYNLRINLSQLEFQGDERIIRMALCNFLWLNCQGQSLVEFFEDSQEFSRLATELTSYTPEANHYVTSKRIQLILSIVLLRIQAGNYTDFKKTPTWFKELSEESLQACLSVQLSKDILHKELQYLSLFCFSGPFFSSLSDPLIKNILGDLETNESSLARLIKAFEHYYLDRFIPASEYELNDILRVNLLCMASGYYLFDQKVPTLFTMVRATLMDQSALFQELFVDIRHFLRKMAKRKGFEWVKIAVNDLAIVYAHLLLPRYEKFRTDQRLKIGLFIDANYLLTQSLVNFLFNQPFLEVIYHQEGAAIDYDYVVTTSTFLVPPEITCKQYIYSFTAKETALIDLYQLLRAEYNQKRAQSVEEKLAVLY